MLTKRALRRENERLTAALRTMTDNRNEQRESGAAHLSSLAHATEKYSDIQDQLIRRTRERDDAIAERDAANKTAEAERFNVQRLAAQLSGVRDEVDTLKNQPAPVTEPPGTELREARRALMLSEQARASLDAQLATVQAANEAMCREAVDRAALEGGAV